MFFSFLIGLLFPIFYAYYRSTKKPKGWKPYKFYVVDQSKRTGDRTRDRYKLHKIPEKIDVIVVGSGIGGLSTAAFLAKNGKRVLVLEQHYIAGGTMHTFSDHGYEFETGIHYIGNIEKRKKLLDLITDQPIEWTKQGYESNDMVYDEIVLGEGVNERHYRFRAGEENFIQDLVKLFPDEEDNIRKYIQLVKTVAKKDTFFLFKIVRPLWLRRLLQTYFTDQTFLKYSQMTVTEVMKDVTSNEELVAVLTGQFGDYGTPSESSFFMHASVVNHYLDGGYYPSGGSGEITKQVINFIEKHGGRVLVDKGVKRILYNQERKVEGIEMDTGDIIYAPVVVSSVGLRNTYGKLLPKPEWSANEDPLVIEKEEVNSLISKIPPSTSFTFLFVGIKESPEQLGLRSSNIWVYPETNYDELLRKCAEDPYNAPMPLFIASAAIKEGASWSERHPGKTSLIVLTLGKKDWFKDWEHEKCDHRSPEYKELKEQLAQRMFKGLFRFYPQLEGKIDFYEVGTPLSIQHYIGSMEGEGYGLSCVPYRFSNESSKYLEPETVIKGLYMTGQDITTLGFTGSLMAGAMTANAIEGYGTMLDVITGRELTKDLEKL